MTLGPRLSFVLLGSLGLVASSTVSAGPQPATSQSTSAQVSPALFAEMRWRMIGPYRGGRSHAVAGVPSQPHVFYMAATNGGVWKTTDAGRTWRPIFDDQPTGSIGAIALAPSDPNVIYVGSGEGLQRADLSTGDGIYKSIDAGKTWTHLGLRDGQQVPQLTVDPRNPDRLFVAVLGHPHGPNEERGIFRSTDGGRTFDKVLYKDENTGGCDVDFDPSNPDIVYAVLWEARKGPWEGGEWAGTTGGIFKSIDGGTSWRQLTKGLPSDGVVEARLAVAPSDPRRLYASVATARTTGMYRSDDGGETWSRVTTDARPATRVGGRDLPLPTVDPKNRDIVYSASVVTWKSTDGGTTWTGIRGAPGGDDYQQIWINPNDPQIMISTADQGTVITLNGGQSWSSWYNQPTAALYHVSTDTAYPYRVCGGQQDSGTACVSSRGNDGQTTFREWHPAGGSEHDFVAPDPLDPDIVYSSKVKRYDRRTGRVDNVTPRPLGGADYRMVRTQPTVFSPVNPRLLYFASNVVWKTTTGGQSWQKISPDLSRKTWEIPASVGKYRTEASAQPRQRGVIYAVAPSPLDVNRIWAGTDDGLIHVTVDGGLNWKDVTPPALTPWQKVSVLDAGHFDARTAYAAINTLRLDDMRPHLYRTHDGGLTWTAITTGIPDGEPTNAIREDPERKGLLFAGTERAVYVSFDDGDHWQSLRLNMPATSMRDLVVKNDDLIVATHGRGFYVLDNITPLRQLNKAVVLFRPQVATRVRWNMNVDTPLPPDEPRAENPPDGAMIDYALTNAASGPVTLEILDTAGRLVRRYSSADPVPPPDPNLPVPAYWVRPPQELSAAAGMHRFLWDLHYPAAPGSRANYPIAAIYRSTAPSPTSPWVLPGQYTVKLSVDGTSYTQPLTVRMDPRVKTPLAGLTQQFTLSKQLYDGIVEIQATLRQLRGMRAQVKALQEQAGQGPAALALAAFDQKALTLEGTAPAGRGGAGVANRDADEEGLDAIDEAAPQGGGRGGAGIAADTLTGVNGTLAALLNVLQAGDGTPATQLVAAATERSRAVAALIVRWTRLSKEDLAALNAALREANLPPVKIDRVKAENEAGPS